MFGLPRNWGFIRDLRDCNGKTIAAVESIALGYGYTIDSAWAVRFTDGTRGFFINRPSEGSAVLPSEKAMAASNIFKPEELAEVVAERMQARQTQERRREADERRQLDELQAKYCGAKA